MAASPAAGGDPVPPAASSTVAERLRTLRVACEGSSGAAPREDGEGAPLSPPERLWVAPKGGGEAGDAAEEKPAAAGGGGGNGRASPGTVEPPRAAEAPSGNGEERQPSGEAEGVDHPQPPPPSSSDIQAADSEENRDPDGQTAAALAPVEEEAPPEEEPAAQGSEEKGSLPGGGGGSPESDGDTDADSSSSLSSPLLSDDDQQDKNENNSPAKKKSELTKKQEPPLVEDLMIILPESVQLMPFGQVSSIIEHQVIIESEKGLPPVNENTVLFKENRHSLGKIFEIFGPVSHPFYLVQFNSPEHIQSKDIKIKDAVCFAPSVESFTQYIFPEKLKQEKGSDASWKNDDEPPPEAIDFSDDEKEKAAKSKKKSQNIKRKKLRSQQNDNDNGPNYQPRPQPPSEYSGGYCRGRPTTRFSWDRPPHVASFPRFYRQPNMTPPYYSSNYAHMQKPPTFCEQQRLESMRGHQYSFPPPSFETVSHNTHFPPPPSPVDWGWPPPCPQNTYEPLLSMLSLPPPPPPPLPPPSIAPNTGSS